MRQPTKVNENEFNQDLEEASEYPLAADVFETSLIFSDLRRRGEQIAENQIERGLGLWRMCRLVKVSPSEMRPRFTLTGHETFTSFIADPEIDISERTAHMIKSIAETYVVRYGFSPSEIAVSGLWKLDRIRSYIDQNNLARERVLEHLTALSAISRRDAIEYIRGLNTYGEEPQEIDADAETAVPARPNSWKRLAIDWSQPEEVIHKTVISALLNELLAVRPEWNDSPLVRDVVRVLRGERP